jgi:group I intron endonuclease
MIYRALLNNGYSNFSLAIIEYCEPENCLEREQYYIDLLNPEYNILKIAGSSLGHKHSQETRANMSAAKQGKNHPFFGKYHSEETLAKMSDSQKAVDRLGVKNPRFNKERPEGAGKPFQRISVLDLLKNEYTEYDSVSAAALALDIKPTIISRYFQNNQKSPYKKRYIFKKI